MTEPQPSPVTFGDALSWEPVSWYEDAVFFQGEWESPDGSFAISADDPYWGQVLERARNTYGDPGITFNTNDETQQRYLVFGDGVTRVPPTVTYRDHNGGMWQQNVDGSISPLLPTGAAGAPVFPAGYVGVDGQYAPVDAQGRQIGPQLSAPTARGSQPYFVENNGQRQYFDGNGRPISQTQYQQLLNPTTVPGQEPAAEQPLSGATRDAIANMQEELKERYSELNSAEQGLSEALLTAAATTDAARGQLSEIQQRIIDAVNDPQYDLDTPYGETAYLRFLRDQVAEIGELVASGEVASEDAAEITQALAALYTASGTDPAAQEQPGAAAPVPEGAAPVPGEAAVPVEAAPVDDFGLGPELAMPDTSLSDLGLGGMGTDPLAGLTSALPSMLSSLPGMLGSATGSNPLNGLSGLSGLAEPIAGLASGLADRGDQQPAADEEDLGAEDDAAQNADDESVDEPQQDPAVDEGQPPVQPEPSAGEPEPEGATPIAEHSEEPVRPPTDVVLPDGSSVTAPSAATAQAMDAHIDGTPLAEAYRMQSVELPPPGTPVVAPINPSALMAGDVGVFKDRLVAALGSDRVFVDGQVQPISVLGSSPDFLGWLRPSSSAEASEPQPAVPAPVAATP